MWWLLACASPSVEPRPERSVPVDSAADSATPEPDDSGIPADSGAAEALRGTPIDPPLEPPDFTVLDATGQVRSQADLQGHPTVLWFFREAEGST
jgi:hypothetical protein